MSLPRSELAKNQKKSYKKNIEYGHITVTIRWDDECNNGHNSFSITGNLYEAGRKEPTICGSIHEKIEKYFPELKKYIKWHLMTSDGPLHYIANTTYHVKSNHVYNYRFIPKNDLLKSIYLINVKSNSINNLKSELGRLQKLFPDYNEGDHTGEYSNKNKLLSKGLYSDFVNYFQLIKLDNPIFDINNYDIEKEKGSGYKESDIEAARNTAVWPDATLEQLMDEDLLRNRLPDLMEEFKKDIESLEFVY